jgi:hypothetical protein
MSRLRWWQRARRWFDQVEKVEGKIGVVERAPQIWKAGKVVKAFVVVWLSGVAATILSWIEGVMLPWFEPWVWTVIGGSVFFTSTGAILLVFYLRVKRFTSQPPPDSAKLSTPSDEVDSQLVLRHKEEERTLQREGITTVLGREEFDRMHPLGVSLDSSQEIHAAWLAGRGVLGPGGPADKHANKITKLILPQPESDSVAVLEKIYASFSISGAIEESLGLLSRKGVEVRLYPGFWGVEFVIGDPTSDHGWAHCSCHVPGVTEDRRIFYRIEKQQTPDAFNALVEAFEAMWAQSQPVRDSAPLPAGDRESVLRLQEVVGDGRAIRLLWEFAERSLLPEVAEKNPAGTYLGSFIKDDVIVPLREAAREWESISSDATLDPIEAQRAFFGMYKAWQELRTAIEECRQILDTRELGHLKGFVELYLGSAKFLESLRTVLARDDLHSLKVWIRDWHDDNPAVEFQLTP